MAGIGRTGDCCLLNPGADARAIAARWLRRFAVVLYQNGVADIATKGLVNSLQIALVSVTGYCERA